MMPGPRVFRSEGAGGGASWLGAAAAGGTRTRTRGRREPRRRHRDAACRRHATGHAVRGQARQPPATTPRTPPALKPPGGGLNFANSDIAFRRADIYRQLQRLQHLRHRDAEEAAAAGFGRVPGGQGDMSVHGNLLFMSVEQTRGRVDCGTKGRTTRRARSGSAASASSTSPTSASRNRWPPCRRAAGRTTHARDRPERHGQHLCLRLSTGQVRPEVKSSPDVRARRRQGPEHGALQHRRDQVLLAAPARAAIVSRPRIFSDPATGAIAGSRRWRPRPRHAGGPGHESVPRHHGLPPSVSRPEPVPGTASLLDISDPVKPVRLDAASDQNFAYWHSGVVQQRRHQGGLHRRVGRRHVARCRATDQLNWGADAIRHRRQETRVPQLLQDAGGADRPGKLRRP